ncbi:SPX domain-containing protein 4 [Tanacetum coccineum]
MKFGKEFGIHLEQTIPEWKDKYLCYKPLKKLLKNPPENNNNDNNNNLQDWFVNILNEELDKFNDFYVDKEEEFVIRFQELKERIEQAKEKSGKDGIFTSESEFSDEMMAIRRDFVTIHGEMVLLKNYSSLNFAGIIKILKKYDKRTGGLLRVHFTQRAFASHFPPQKPLDSIGKNCSMPIGEGTSDVYRRTVDAINTIKGLKKESSTSNPLSFASIFGNQDIDTGAITAEDDSQSETDSGDVPPTK